MTLRTFDVFATYDNNKFLGTVSAKSHIEARQNASIKFGMKKKELYVDLQK